LLLIALNSISCNCSLKVPPAKNKALNPTPGKINKNSLNQAAINEFNLCKQAADQGDSDAKCTLP